MSQEKQRKQFKNPIWGLGSFQALAMFRRGLFYTFLSVYLNDFLKLSVTATTLYATIPMILSVVGQNLIWGPLSDKIQKRRTLIIIGEVVAGILLTIVWFLHSIAIPYSKTIAGYIVISGLTVIELFWSMSNIGWSALISDLYPSKKRSKMMGWLNSIGGVGRIIGATIGGLLYGSVTWKYVGWGFKEGVLFMVASGVMLLSTIPMFFTQEGGVKKKNHSEVQESKTNAEEDPVLNLDKAIVRKIYLLFILALIFINFGRNSIATIQSQYLFLEDGFAVDAITLSYIANARSIAVILFGVITGWICKKIGEDNVMLIGALIAVLSLVIFSLPVSLIAIYGANVGLGISELVIFAASYTYASKLIPQEKRARLFAVYNATFFLSWGLSGTVIIGPIVDLLIKITGTKVFSYRISFIVAAGITFIGVILLFALTIYTRKLKIRKEIINLF